MHEMWLWTSSRHLSSDSELSYFKKHASLAFFVSGQAQQLQRHSELDPVSRSSSFDAHGLSPCGFSGFCFGSAGSYGHAAGGPGGVAGENQPVICAIVSQSAFVAKPSKTKARRTLSTNMFRTRQPLLEADGNKLRKRAFPPSGTWKVADVRSQAPAASPPSSHDPHPAPPRSALQQRRGTCSVMPELRYLSGVRLPLSPWFRRERLFITGLWWYDVSGLQPQDHPIPRKSHLGWLFVSRRLGGCWV